MDLLLQNLCEGHKIGSLLDQIKRIKMNHKDDLYKLACETILIGRKVIKKKNDHDVFGVQVYTIEGMDWTGVGIGMGSDPPRTEPALQWQNDSRNFSLLDLYEDRHGSKVTDLDQPIILAKLDNGSEQEHRLIPEFCEPSFEAESNSL